MKRLPFFVAAMTALAAHVALAQASGSTASTAATATGKGASTTSKGSTDTSKSKGTSTNGAAMRATAENTPQCQHIIAECKKQGFIDGQYKVDNGLWKDCFDPVVSGKGSATQQGKPAVVPPDPGDVKACHAALIASKKG